jgi:hypothetical protein
MSVRGPYGERYTVVAQPGDDHLNTAFDEALEALISRDPDAAFRCLTLERTGREIQARARQEQNSADRAAGVQKSAAQRRLTMNERIKQWQPIFQKRMDSGMEYAKAITVTRREVVASGHKVSEKTVRRWFPKKEQGMS